MDCCSKYNKKIMTVTATNTTRRKIGHIRQGYIYIYIYIYIYAGEENYKSILIYPNKETYPFIL